MITNPNGPPKNAVRPGRMGLVKYAQIFASIYAEPKTHLQVAAETKRGEQTIRELLWRMQQLGIVHVAGWTPASRSIDMALFRAGPGISLPYPRPRKRVPGTPSKANIRPEVVHFAKIMRCLLAGCTCEEARVDTGIAKMRFGHVATALRKAGILHIAGWLRHDSGSGMPARILQIGRGPDATRPKPITDQEKNRRYLAGKQAQRATLDVINAITRSGANAQRMGIKPYHMLGKSAVQA